MSDVIELGMPLTVLSPCTSTSNVMGWLILLILLLLVVGFLLMTPIVFLLDTDKDLYRVSIWGLMRADLVADDEHLLIVVIRIGFLKWRFLPFAPQDKQVAEKPGQHRKARKRSGGISSIRVRRLVRSFRVRVCDLDCDTGHMLLNAWLYPLCMGLSNEKRMLKINFNQKQHLRLVISNRLINIIGAVI